MLKPSDVAIAVSGPLAPMPLAMRAVGDLVCNSQAFKVGEVHSVHVSQVNMCQLAALGAKPSVGGVVRLLLQDRCDCVDCRTYAALTRQYACYCQEFAPVEREQ
jgi:uncharacterized protein (UPF0179 family)